MESLIRNHIDLADRHLREAEERIAAQLLRVAGAAGREGEKAAALLETFLQIRDQMQIHRDLLDEVLRLAVSARLPLD